ncbi:MAG: M28 family peptidase, partial [Blastocatellia bacterium]
MRKELIPAFILLIALTLGASAVIAQKKTTPAPATTSAAIPATAPDTPAAGNGKHGGVELITAAQLKDYLTFVASDEMEGRETPSRGLDLTAKFIAMNLSRWGIKPAGDNGTFMQTFKLRRGGMDPVASTATINGLAFKALDGFLGSAFDGAASGQMVYAGHGWVVKSKNINPYQNIDVRGKILVVHAGAFPKGASAREFTQMDSRDWINAGSYAKQNGAAGVILIPTERAISRWEVSKIQAQQSGRWMMESNDEDNAQLPTITASAEMLRAIFDGEPHDQQTLLHNANNSEFPASFALKADKKAEFKVALKMERVNTQNVVGIIEGSDPVLKNEYVAIGAHYDHVGMMPPGTPGDRIFNGADDDGSGTVSVMAIAEAFAKGPRPKRSLLFVWHAGEEKGLWGSEYITDHPPVPVTQIITQLNIDMVGRSRLPGDNQPANKFLTGPHEVYLIGSKKMSSELGALSESVNRDYLNLQINYKYDNANDPERFFYRSDHYN